MRRVGRVRHTDVCLALECMNVTLFSKLNEVGAKRLLGVMINAKVYAHVCCTVTLRFPHMNCIYLQYSLI